jgi:hypothetical protein
MGHDNVGRLASWTAPTGTTATDGFPYDNAGDRMLQRVNNGTVTIIFDGYSETVLSGADLRGVGLTGGDLSEANPTVAWSPEGGSLATGDTEGWYGFFGGIPQINCRKNCQYASFIEMGISSSEVRRGRKGISEQWMGRSPPSDPFRSCIV